MRIAMLGAGHMGTMHAAAWEQVDGVTVSWVVGSSSKRARDLAERLGARHSTESRAALEDTRVDAVDVTVPTIHHPALVGAALDAGKHVLCETPLARTSAEAEAMVDRAHGQVRHLQVALLNRFARQSVFFRDRIRSGELGSAQAVSAYRRAPETDGAHHGDALEELMLFDLDFLLWTLGEPSVLGASAWRDRAGSIRQAVALLDFEGTRATVESSFLFPRSHPFTTGFLAACDRGAIEARFTAPRDAPPTARCATYPVAGAPTVDTGLGEEPVLAECRHFAAVVEQAADPRLLDGSSAVQALRLAERIREVIV